eukprot:TRINITY_DN715_c0_g1_i12.p1 TRINITY_DN715_c0_g1~~TRINITY_DN715_c0_g1_i12.p1  ORF type:complete len:139 (+),score=41.45 TRINITY_DN715_c0_g1_i12:128-544(+)
MLRSLVGSEMCIRDRYQRRVRGYSSGMVRSIVARWSFMARFGKRGQAIELAQEWVSSFGVRAGMKKHKTSINSGGFGPATSLVEINTEFGSMAEMETFFDAFHRADLRGPQSMWLEKMDKAVVSGTPKWEVLHVVKLS